MSCATLKTTTRIPLPLCSTLYPPKGGYTGGGAATGANPAPPCATLRRLQFVGVALLDPGLFAARYGFKGFLGLVAFAAITEAAWRSL